MKIEKRKNGDVVILDIKGKILFGEGVEDLRQEIQKMVDSGEKKVLMNFADVPYLDSTGLGEVIRCYTTMKKNGGDIKIINLTNNVRDLLSVTKLITVFETYNNEEEAVKSFK